jgi:hypothetical protein
MARHKRTPLEQVFADYRKWINELSVVEDELRLMLRKLGEIGSKYGGHIMLVHINHYKDLVNQRNRELQKLNKSIEKEEVLLVKHSRKPNQELNDEFVKTYEVLREEMILERKLSKWLKNEYSKFASQHP